MTIEVQLFARARELAGGSPLRVELPERATVGDLRSALVTAAPKLERIAPSLFIALNGDYAHDETPIPAEVEVACFPPVSGG
jgi:molybdopterin synthase sulfur carrier subunit